MRWRVLAALVCLAVLAASCDVRILQEGEGDPDGGSTSVGDVSIERSAEAPPHSSVSEMVDRVLPSVVNVKVTSITSDIFGNTRQTRGQGSGVVIDPNGIILTNNHVIRDATSVRVVFTDPDQKALEGTVIRAVPDRDLAIIKVEAKDLPAITIGHSERLELGDEVVAIGFPLGLGGPTVTKGIVSGKNRDISVNEGDQQVTLKGLVQTDAAINPGNSGGALVDLNGALVGINTAAAQASAAENIGFAIAMDEALPVIRESLENPEPSLPWLGVQIAPATPQVKQQLGLPPDLRGAIVVGVFPDSPAADAGVRPFTQSRPGDVIVGIDEDEIVSSEDLTDTLNTHQPGDEVELRLVSPSGTRSVTVELGLRPANFPTPDEG